MHCRVIDMMKHPARPNHPVQLGRQQHKPVVQPAKGGFMQKVASAAFRTRLARAAVPALLLFAEREAHARGMDALAKAGNSRFTVVKKGGGGERFESSDFARAAFRKGFAPGDRLEMRAGGESLGMVVLPDTSLVAFAVSLGIHRPQEAGKPAGWRPLGLQFKRDTVNITRGFGYVYNTDSLGGDRQLTRIIPGHGISYAGHEGGIKVYPDGVKDTFPCYFSTIPGKERVSMMRVSHYFFTDVHSTEFGVDTTAQDLSDSTMAHGERFCQEWAIIKCSAAGRETTWTDPTKFLVFAFSYYNEDGSPASAGYSFSVAIGLSDGDIWPRNPNYLIANIAALSVTSEFRSGNRILYVSMGSVGGIYHYQPPPGAWGPTIMVESIMTRQDSTITDTAKVQSQAGAVFPNPLTQANGFKANFWAAADSALSPIDVQIFDVLGRRAWQGQAQPERPGDLLVGFDASGLASGTYFARIGGEKSVRKFAVIR